MLTHEPRQHGRSRHLLPREYALVLTRRAFANRVRKAHEAPWVLTPQEFGRARLQTVPVVRLFVPAMWAAQCQHPA